MMSLEWALPIALAAGWFASMLMNRSGQSAACAGWREVNSPDFQ